MFPRKRVRFSDCVSTFGDNPNSKASASGELRLPMHTLKLLMRKCQVRLTRCDDEKLRRRATEPAKSSKSEKVGKEQRKSLESLCSLKREVSDLEEKENWLAIDTDTLLIPQVKIEVDEEDEHCIKPSFSQLEKFMFDKPCHVRLTRCDEKAQDVKPEVKLKHGISTFWLRDCQVVLFRCDDVNACKMEGKGVIRQTTAKNRRLIKRELVPCYLCEKLVTPSYMFRHLNKHTGEKPYKCPVCPDKAYLFQSELTYHMKRHAHDLVATSGKTKVCSKKRLQHTKRSSGHHRLNIKREQVPEEPVKKKLGYSLSKYTNKPTCVICERSFCSKNRLIYHVRAIHTLERPFSCPICDWRFVDAPNLNFHVKRRH